MRATSRLSPGAPLLLVVLHLGCAQVPPVRVALPTQESSVLVSIAFPDGPPVHGELARARITIGNGSSQALIVRGVEFPGQIPELETWVISRPGRIDEERQRDRMQHDSRAPGETGPVFVRGLVLPGEAIAVERFLRVRAPTFDVVLHSSAFDSALLRDVVLFRDADSDRGGRSSYTSGSNSTESRFRRLRPEDPEREVLVPLLHEFGVERRHFRVDTLIADESPVPQVLAALESVDGEARGGEVSQWTSGGAWLVRSPRDHVLRLLFEDGSREDLRGVDFDVFDLADLSARDGLDIVFEARVALDGSGGNAPRSDTGDERGDPGASVPVEPEAASFDVDEDVVAESAVASEDGILDGESVPGEAVELEGDELVAVAPEIFLETLKSASRRGLKLRVDWIDPDAAPRDLCIRGR